MLNLKSTIELDFKKFFRWWKKELGFLVPEKIKQLVNDKQGLIVVRTVDNQLELIYRIDDQGEPLITVDRNETGITQAKAYLANDDRLAKADVVLRLSRQDGLHKVLVLPAAVKENLNQVVSYELSRYTPFNSEQVYFAVKPLDVANEPGQIRVMLVLTPKEILDACYEDTSSMGLSPLFADYEGAPNDLDQIDEAYNLLPEWLGQKTAHVPRLVYSGLAAAVLLLLGAVIAMPIWFEYQAVNLLTEKISDIEKDAKNIKELQSVTDKVIAETSELIALKKSAPPVLDLLNSLSALIKGDTWLSYAQYSADHLQIQGESPAASGLIAVLEDSSLFSNAKFVSPVTQDPTSGLERFQITVDITKTGGTGDQN